MTPKELYDRFRADVVDAVEPFLWSKAEVLGYMDDAQKWLCRRAYGIRDASSDAARVDVAIGEAFSDLSPAVLYIRGATRASDGRKVRIFSYEEASGIDANHEDVGYFRQSFMDASGPVIAAIVGMEEEKLRLVQTPAADDTLNLVIERLPLEAPTLDADSELEVREEHHLALLLWMKHLAFAKEDSETYDRERSRDFEQRFFAYCEVAKAEKERRNSKPRLIAYGGL